jgi:hypothetical protein
MQHVEGNGGTRIAQQQISAYVAVRREEQGAETTMTAEIFIGVPEDE